MFAHENLGEKMETDDKKIELKQKILPTVFFKKNKKNNNSLRCLNYDFFD